MGDFVDFLFNPRGGGDTSPQSTAIANAIALANFQRTRPLFDAAGQSLYDFLNSQAGGFGVGSAVPGLGVGVGLPGSHSIGLSNPAGPQTGGRQLLPQNAFADVYGNDHILSQLLNATASPQPGGPNVLGEPIGDTIREAVLQTVATILGEGDNILPTEGGEPLDIRRLIADLVEEGRYNPSIDPHPGG